MKAILKITVVAALAALTAAPIAVSKENSVQGTSQMMQGSAAMGGDMSGMQDMMKMMQMMGPMMKACTEMMQAMASKHETGQSESKEN